MREDYVHFCVRKFLRNNSWLLLAGEYPNGSDDELHPLSIKDPLLAKDGSPDHRRHANNKLVPDLVASKNNKILIIELKPKYSRSDQEKLIHLFQDRYKDLVNALNGHVERYFSEENFEIDKMILIPVLGFNEKSDFDFTPNFEYLLVRENGDVNFYSGENK